MKHVMSTFFFMMQKYMRRRQSINPRTNITSHTNMTLVRLHQISVFSDNSHVVRVIDIRSIGWAWIWGIAETRTGYRQERGNIASYFYFASGSWWVIWMDAAINDHVVKIQQYLCQYNHNVIHSFAFVLLAGLLCTISVSKESKTMRSCQW